MNLIGSQNFNCPDDAFNLKGVKFACDNIIAGYIRERFNINHGQSKDHINV